MSIQLLGIHHVALIASDYARSKHFYVNLLGAKVRAEHYRTGRQSYKLDLQLPDGTQLELFSFPSPPARPSRPEACGLRHLAFRVASVENATQILQQHGIEVEAIRVDECTGRRFTFFSDPDGLPLELYEDPT